MTRGTGPEVKTNLRSVTEAISIAQPGTLFIWDEESNRVLIEVSRNDNDPTWQMTMPKSSQTDHPKQSLLSALLSSKTTVVIVRKTLGTAQPTSLRLAISIPAEAREYVDDCQQGGTFNYERLSALPSQEAINLLVQSFLFCMAQLNELSTPSMSDQTFKEIAGSLIADSLPYRHFSPLQEVLAMVRPLVAD